MLHKSNPFKDGLGDMLTDFGLAREPFADRVFCSGGDGGGGGGGGGGSSGGGGGGGGGTIFGVDGVSKTGSTSQDADIGWTSAEGSGQAGDNYEALQSATSSEVAQAQEMADAGATTQEIGEYLSGDLTPDAGTIGTSSSGGNVESTSEATAQQFVAREGTSAPQFLTSTFDSVSSALTGGAGAGVSSGGSTAGSATTGGAVEATADDGFDTGTVSAPLEGSAATNTLKRDPEAAVRAAERRADYFYDPVVGNQYAPPGYDPALSSRSKIQDLFTSRNENTGAIQAPLTRTSGLTASTDGSFAMLTPEQMNKLGANLNKKYSDPSYLNLGNMTPGAQAVAFSEISRRYPDQEYGRVDQKLGGQSIVRNMRLVGQDPATGNVMLEGGSKGFFGSTFGSVFGLPLSGGASMAYSMAGMGNRAKNLALDKDTAGMIALGADAVGLPGSFVNQGLQLAGINANRFLPQFEGSVSEGTTIFQDTGGGNDNNQPPVNATPPTQDPPPGNVIKPPSTAPTDLVRRKRIPGQGLFGTTTNEFPFLALSEELKTSGLGTSAKSPAGKFRQNAPR